MIRDDLAVVLDAAERRARQLLNEASKFERTGQAQLVKETMNDHYEPLRAAIDSVSQYREATFGG
jgi:hypothetical protein